MIELVNYLLPLRGLILHSKGRLRVEDTTGMTGVLASLPNGYPDLMCIMCNTLWFCHREKISTDSSLFEEL